MSGHILWDHWVTRRLLSQLNSPTGSIQADLRILLDCIENFRSNFPRDGNPVGSNAEVARALQGSNAKNVIVIVGSKTKLNDKGEFIDPWQTPLRIYFSGEGILIRSAGPNRRFDDSSVLECDDFFRSN